MTLPNKITFFRLLITPVGVALLFATEVPYRTTISAGIFLFAMCTDVLDGYIARTRNLMTRLGAFIDPLSDKLLILLYFLFLQFAGVYPLWLLMVMFAREIIMDAFRSFAMSQSLYIGAVAYGKIKAFLQTISIGAGLLFLAVRNGEFTAPLWALPALSTFAFWTMLLAFCVSVVGFLVILKRNHAVLLEQS
ncbi:MAG: CDP-diacylglycerol--glycerol-3-phosphate 3-phosphatidyltransferase [Candidatus Peribacteraceae bacterium]|nr:CDP-diacylglycerol--glycerol-3-phosphate 3-phosphatidyltransferase [Candidatus Peribacteraceae bacterium]